MAEPTEGSGRNQDAETQSTSDQADQHRLERTAAAQTLFIGLEMFRDYGRKLKIHVKPATTDEARRIAERIKLGTPNSTLYPRLITLDGIVVLRDLWLASDFLSNDDRRLLGVQEQFLAQLGKPVTRRSLGKALHHWYTADEKGHAASPAREQIPEAYVRSAERIVDAAIFYSLIEAADSKHKHMKPLRCTARLDDLMKSCVRPTLRRLSSLRNVSID